VHCGAASKQSAHGGKAATRASIVNSLSVAAPLKIWADIIELDAYGTMTRDDAEPRDTLTLTLPTPGGAVTKSV
jgi:hypothetical protein